MSASYRFLLADLLTDAILAELPVESASYTEVLNAPGSLSATIRLGLPPVTEIPDDPAFPGVDQGTAQSPAPDVQAGAQAIYVERDGTIVWGGVIWTFAADVAANTGTIGAEGFFSLLRGRVLETAYGVTARDQTLIVQDLLDTIQAYTEGDILLDTTTITASGVTRDRAWSAWEWKDVGEAIEQLAAVDGGFDFRIRSSWSAGAIIREFITTYPATGRSTSYVLELGRNLELLSFTDDATTVANKVYVRGEGDDVNALTTTLHNTGTGLARRDLVVAHNDVSVLSTLVAHATRYATRGAAAIRIPYVSIYPNQEPRLGSFIVGDIVELRGTFGAIDFAGNYRITSWKAAVDTSGNENVQLTLAPLEVF